MPSSATTSLRETQAPLKEAYRADPSAAQVTLKSSGTLDASNITCKLSTGAAVQEANSRTAGLHPKAGGPEASISGELCSGDMLLDALVACAGVTLKAVATALDIPITSGTVSAEGDLDFRGTMGVDKTAPVGFTALRMKFDVGLGDREDGRPVQQEEMEKLGMLTERYCVVLQTVRRGLEARFEVLGTEKSKDEGVKERTLVYRHMDQEGARGM